MTQFWAIIFVSMPTTNDTVLQELLKKKLPKRRCIQSQDYIFANFPVPNSNSYNTLVPKHFYPF